MSKEEEWREPNEKTWAKHDRAMAWIKVALGVAYAVLAWFLANDAWELGTESGALIRWLLAVLLVLFAIQRFGARPKWGKEGAVT